MFRNIIVPKLGDFRNCTYCMNSRPSSKSEIRVRSLIYLPSKDTGWTNNGPAKDTNRYQVAPHSFGGFGLCKWRKVYKQKQERKSNTRKLCYECLSVGCDGEECEWVIKRGPTNRDRRIIDTYENRTTIQSIIQNSRGKATGCCTNPWTGESSCAGT